MKRLSTSEVAERLGVAQVTVNVWCLQGKFPNAEREETARGPVWAIPESDLSSFVKPAAGRPPKSSPDAGKRATGQIRARNGTSTGKQKGGQQ